MRFILLCSCKQDNYEDGVGVLTIINFMQRSS